MGVALECLFRWITHSFGALAGRCVESRAGPNRGVQKTIVHVAKKGNPHVEKQNANHPCE